MDTQKLKLEKERFFAQYWGQLILALHVNDKGYCINSRNIRNIESNFLELTDITEITDEEATEVANILGIRGDNLKQIVIQLFNGGDTFLRGNVNWFDFLSAYQFLQSRGYALPFMNYPITQLIEMGWIKIK